jgi:hypothetical protein
MLVKPLISADSLTASATCEAHQQAKQALAGYFCCLLIGVGFLVSVGCSSLTVPKTAFSSRSKVDPSAYENGFELDPGSAEIIYHAVRAARANNAVVLQISGEKAGIKTLPLPEDGQAVYVSQMLNQTGTMKKLGGVTATLFRYSTTTIGGLRMEVKMSPDFSTVKLECDYALQPGDRLRVSRASSSALNQLFEVAGL